MHRKPTRCCAAACPALATCRRHVSNAPRIDKGEDRTIEDYSVALGAAARCGYYIHMEQGGC